MDDEDEDDVMGTRISGKNLVYCIDKDDTRYPF